MKLYLPITVDLYNIYPLRVLNLQQNNVGRGALITLTAAGVVIVPDSESLYVYAQKKDGTMVYNTCTLKDNQIQVDFDEQMTVESGILQVELQMVDTSGNSITTPIFQINVQKSNIDYQKITSQDSFQALVTTLAEVQELKKNGLKGDPGEAATIQIGTVTASDPGADPEVTNSGTQQDAVLNFVFPRGIQGPMGPKGDPGTANAATVAYDNSTSEAAETNAQDAFDKLYGDITQLTEKREWTKVSFVGAVDVTLPIPSNKCANVPSTAEEIYVEITVKRNVSTTIKFSHYLKTPGDYIGGYYNSEKYYGSYQLGYSNNIIYLNKSWLRVVDNGTAYDNSNTVQVDVYYR